MWRSIIFIQCLLMAIGASAQFKGYEYARAVTPVNQNGYYSILLDAEMLARSKSNFDDYRIYEAKEKDTLETPFLFRWQDESIETYLAEGKIIDRSYLPGGTQFLTVEFDQAKRVNELHFSITETNFDKYIKVEASDDNRNWKIIAERLRIVGINWWGAYFRSVSTSFNESSSRFFRITVSNVAWSPYKGHKDNITVNGIKSTFNKCLSGSFRQVKNLSVYRKDYIYDPSLKNDTLIYGAFLEMAPHPKAVNRRTDFRNPFNPTTISVQLPGTMHIHHIRVVSRDTGDFYRKIAYRVTKKDNRTEKEFFEAGDNIFSSVTSNVYDCGNAFGDQLQLCILNFNNRPLGDIDIEMFTQDARLLCKLDAGRQYFLYYAKSNDYKPQYDLQYFKQNVDAVNDVQLSKELRAAESVVAAPEPFVKNKLWLWLLMVSLLLFIGFFALKLMKKQENS